MNDHSTEPDDGGAASAKSDRERIEVFLAEAGSEYFAKLASFGRDLCAQRDGFEWGQPGVRHGRVIANGGRRYLDDGIRSTSPFPVIRSLRSNAPPTSPPAKTWEEKMRLERHWTVTPEEHAAWLAAELAADRARDGR